MRVDEFVNGLSALSFYIMKTKMKHKTKKISVKRDETNFDKAEYLNSTASNVRELIIASGGIVSTPLEDAAILLEQEIRKFTNPEINVKVSNDGVSLRRLFAGKSNYITERSIHISFPMSLDLLAQCIKAFELDGRLLEEAIKTKGVNDDEQENG